MVLSSGSEEISSLSSRVQTWWRKKCPKMWIVLKKPPHSAIYDSCHDITLHIVWMIKHNLVNFVSFYYSDILILYDYIATSAPTAEVVLVTNYILSMAVCEILLITWKNLQIIFKEAGWRKVHYGKSCNMKIVYTFRHKCLPLPPFFVIGYWTLLHE